MRQKEQNKIAKSQKLRAIIEKYASGVQVELANMIGVSGSVIHQWLKNETLNAELLLYTFPDLSAEWLMRGEGPMLLSEIKSHQVNTITQGDHSAASINGTPTATANTNHPDDTTDLHTPPSGTEAWNAITSLIDQNRALTTQLDHLIRGVRQRTDELLTIATALQQSQHTHGSTTSATLSEILHLLKQPR